MRFKILAATIAFSHCVSAAETPAIARAKDVPFLLDELEKRAGHFFKVKGIDWAAVRKEFTASAANVKDDVEHLTLCNRLVARLRDGHAGLRDTKVKFPDLSAGRRWSGSGLQLLSAGDTIFASVAVGSAQKSGIVPGTIVTSIGGKPATDWLRAAAGKGADDRGFSTAHQARYWAGHWGLADWSDTSLELEFLRDGATVKATLPRDGGNSHVPYGPIHPPRGLKQIGRQSYGRTAVGNAYIHLRDIPGDLPAQLDAMLATVGDAPGLILDMRANGGGGCDHADVFGRFVPAGKTWRGYPSTGAKPFAGRMIVIVDAGVRSAGETVAGQFKEDGRAYMIGPTPTAGMSSSKTTLAVPSGLFSVYFSVASNKGRFNGGRGIEGIGVPPNEVTAYDPAEVSRGVDTQIRLAEELLKSGFPKGSVPYEDEK
jgi:carboxyl-terminal processing protease